MFEFLLIIAEWISEIIFREVNVYDTITKCKEICREKSMGLMHK